MLICPVCKSTLVLDGNCWKCVKGHSYDKARQGYVNLLLVTDKNSKKPGDNEVMVTARKKFLDGGYYGELARFICDKIKSLNVGNPVILDCGCGEGYYSDQIKNNVGGEVYAFDISKYAVKTAAANYKRVNFFVASAYSVPVLDESVDIITRIFAPACYKEYLRLLKSGGYVVTVTPDKEHLIELKQALYDDVYLNPEREDGYDGFTKVFDERLKYSFQLNTADDLISLFEMTPYVYTTDVEATERLKKSGIKQVTADFRIEILQKI